MLPLQLQPQSHVPLYIQLRDQLRALVHTGELRPGDRIPASRELATQLGVHRTTVANAYAELESEGLIQGHVGRGTFIRGTTAPLKFTPAPAGIAAGANGGVRWESLFADERGEEALSRLLDAAPNGGVSFVVARPAEEVFPVEEIRQCCNVVLRRDGARILQLGPTDGYAPLKEVLLSWLRSEGLAVKDENLLITDGCQQALDLLCKAFLRPGDSVLLENPTYPGSIAIFAGARVRCLGVPVHTGSDPGSVPGVDIGALEATLMQNRVKLMVLTPDFQNPTGTTLPVAARRRLLELAARHQVPIVEDHIYARLRTSGEKVPSLKHLDRANVVIQVDSFSKVAFPGLRVGWCIAPEKVIERLRLVKQTTDLHTDQLAQAALAEFTKRGWLERHLARTRKLYARRLGVMQQALARYMPEGVRWTRPEGGMCVWVELPLGFDASELLIHVREKGVLFAPGRYFYFQHPQPNTLRLGFAGLDEPQITRGIATLGQLLVVEMRKRSRGYGRSLRSEAGARVALV
jgi:2-aminoadipate transaminase